MKKMSILKIIGIVVLVAGIVVLIMGAYDLIKFNISTGGKIANNIAGFFGTKTETVKNCIIQICIGLVCSVTGFVLYKKG
ncbi:MAG: hypothetical protein LBB89_01345 [Treponema sp.]|jgi:hypothetical protein|nr:hypothetical protein [Treponema sp.]